MNGAQPSLPTASPFLSPPLSILPPQPAPPAPAPSTPPRNLVVCLDGTSNQFSSKNTNVIKLFSTLEIDEKTQLAYYDSGVGTYLPAGAGSWGKAKQKVAEVADLAVAWNFDDHVQNAYKWLMDYYRAGDKIYIFGFSRGAYTARTLAGMIQKVGLLPPGNHSQVSLAYEVYHSPTVVKRRGNMLQAEVDTDNRALAASYRRIFGISKTVNIHFIGVWDTVSSLGGIDLPKLPFAAGVRMVRFFRQALALDERRAKFQPEYRHVDAEESKHDPVPPSQVNHLALQATRALATIKQDKDAVAVAAAQSTYKAAHMLTSPGDDTCGSEDNCKCLARNKEVWFMGCHSDCGGGNDENGKPSLSNISFRWMIREAEECGLRIDPIGVCFLPALVATPATTHFVPPHLIAMLQAQFDGVADEHEQDLEIEAMVRTALPRNVIHEIIHEAAAFDTAMEGDAGGPITDDLVRLPLESLTPPWYPLEIFILQTREYGGGSSGATSNDSTSGWRMNLGRGRQMREGQAVHRSVQKKLRYDAHDVDGHARYEGPHAMLPEGWKTSWKQLAGEDGEDVWED